MDNVQYIAENFECPVCGQKFTTVYNAFGHLNDKHPAGEGEPKKKEDEFGVIHIGADGNRCKSPNCKVCNNDKHPTGEPKERDGRK